MQKTGYCSVILALCLLLTACDIRENAAILEGTSDGDGLLIKRDGGTFVKEVIQDDDPDKAMKLLHNIQLLPMPDHQPLVPKTKAEMKEAALQRQSLEQEESVIARAFSEERDERVEEMLQNSKRYRDQQKRLARKRLMLKRLNGQSSTQRAIELKTKGAKAPVAQQRKQSFGQDANQHDKYPSANPYAPNHYVKKAKEMPSLSLHQKEGKHQLDMTPLRVNSEVRVIQNEAYH